MIELMQSELGYKINTDAGKNTSMYILPPSGIDQYTRELLTELKNTELNFLAPENSHP